MNMNKRAGNTITSLLSVLGLVSLLFGLLVLSSPDVLQNPLLDNESIAAINTLNTQVDSIDISESTVVNNVTVNSTFEGTDAFQREFLESKSIAEGENKNVIERILGVPNLLVTSLGVPQDETLTFILNLVGVIAVFIITLVVYKGWKTGQVDN